MSTLVESIKAKLHQHFNPKAARNIHNVFMFELSDGDTYTLTVDDGTMQFHEGSHPTPDIVFMTDRDTLKKIFNGEASGATAMMMGDIKVKGDWIVATRLKRLFPHMQA
ncbi:SCP2 sterol-binding domain-containing protein [Larsenimonas salina]|uniref:SCP2 sterol-binding domain-containing protein n=1 Tax=Larsenimonas salina TaxID=1295565 RepID=UPI0020734E30|nr:SCP2 sterol-binding domain-containing protein [Larsenimonas salina]MCM5703376.1 SCP2 sterol-binding domain-containing protein [Larsenimonas salina]